MAAVLVLGSFIPSVVRLSARPQLSASAQQNAASGGPSVTIANTPLPVAGTVTVVNSALPVTGRVAVANTPLPVTGNFTLAGIPAVTLALPTQPFSAGQSLT